MIYLLTLHDLVMQIKVIMYSKNSKVLCCCRLVLFQIMIYLHWILYQVSQIILALLTSLNSFPWSKIIEQTLFFLSILSKFEFFILSPFMKALKAVDMHAALCHFSLHLFLSNLLCLCNLFCHLISVQHTPFILFLKLRIVISISMGTIDYEEDCSDM